MVLMLPYIPKPGEESKGREPLLVQGMFGTILLIRQYYYHPGKKCGHFPADAALGLEGGVHSGPGPTHLPRGKR